MGKTTTIRSIIGLTPPRRGRVLYGEKNITALPPEKISKLGIGLVPQGRYIFPSLSVTENLTMAARGAGKADSWSLDEVYSLFPILKERSNCRGTLLSGGEQQMLAVGRALMTNPQLLLMDEPSEGLAPLIVKEVGKIIQQLKRKGFSILLVEQNLPMALKIADYLYILSNGKIVYESTPEQLKSNDEIKAKYIGVAG
jgi:branched-chain amino acid transport system ATP-binding protein